MKLTNQVYDVLKWGAQIVLPAAGTLYFALSAIWGLPYGEQVVGTITAVVIPYVRSKTTSTQQAEIAAWVKIAVTAAEQIYTGSGQGKAKKEYVVVWLDEHGVTVDTDKLDAMIESAVYSLKNGGAAA